MTPDPNAPPPIDPGEAALVVIGLSNVITRDVPKIGVGKLEEIGNVGKRVTALGRELVAGELQGKKVPREHGYRALLDRLKRGLSPDEIHELTTKFPADASDVSGPFLVAVQQAMTHLDAIFPVSEYVTFTGPRNMTPPEDAIFTFLLQYMVLSDPLSVFNLMATGALLRSQAATVTQFFPTLAPNITAAVDAAVVREVATHGQSWRVPPRAAIGIANWKGSRTVDYQPGAPVPRVVPGVKRPAALGAVAKMAQQQTPQSAGTPA
jgi:hypothetical protein